MNLSKSILGITLTEVMNDEVVTQETKDRLKELVDSNNTQEIERLILRNLIFFAKYSVVKEIYNNPIFMDACLSFMKTSNFKDTEQLLSRLEESIDIKAFLNQKLFINEFLKNDNLLSILGRINGFFDNFSGSFRKGLINKFLLKEKIDIVTLQRLPHDVIDSLLIDDIYKELIWHAFLERLLSGILVIDDSYIEEKIWKTYHERITLLSLNNKVDYFKNIKNEELKIRVFESLNFTEDIDNLTKFQLKFFIPYLDQDILYNKCISKDIDTITTFIQYLDKDHQMKAVYELDKLGVRINNYYGTLNTEVRLYIFDNYRHLIDSYNIYRLYQETQNISCLEELKTRFLKSDDIMVNVLYEDDFVKLLTEEEKEALSLKIPVDGYIRSSYDVIKMNHYFYNIAKTKNIDYLRQHPDVRAYIGQDDLMDYYNISEQLEIIKHKDLSWLRDILENDKKFNFFVNILHHDPKFLMDKDLSNLKIGYVNNKLLDRIGEILPYFKEDQLYLFFNDRIINSHSKILELFKGTVNQNPNLIFSLNLLDHFNQEEQNALLRNMSIDHLNDIMHAGYLKQHTYILDILYERFNEYVNYINAPKLYGYIDISDIYLLLDDSKKEELISKITNVDTLEHLLLYLQKQQSYEDCEQVLSRIIYNYEGNSDIKLKLSYYDNVNLQYFITNSSLLSLMYTSNYYANKDIINMIISYIQSDNKVLVNEELLPYVNMFIVKLNETDRTYISEQIDQLINDNQLYNHEYKNKLGDISYSDKLEFLYLYKSGILQGNKKDIFDRLLQKNPFLLNSIHSIMFNDNILSLGEHFVEKTSKYPIMERQLNSLNKNNPQILDFLKQAGHYLLSNNISQIAFDKEIAMIIEYLSSSKSKLNNYDFSLVNEQMIADIVNYILYEYENLIVVYNSPYEVYKTVNELYTLSIDNFSKERLTKCDEEFNKCTDINDKKNMYFNKYLSMSLSDAKNFYKSYVVNYHKVIQYAESTIPIKFIELISKVLEIEDPIALEEIYKTTTISYSIADRFTIEGIMQKAYFESLVNDYKNKQQGSAVTKQFKDKDGNVVSLEMTELIDNFGIILHSTCAYGEMPLLDNDYFTSWNNNPNTENHGICCSYITNSSYGTAAVSGNGVMFGFTELNNSSISTYSPYDLSTKNNGYNIDSRYIPYYTVLDDISNFTRHTHNEVNLERRNDSIDCRFASVQPNCIIIFEDMDESIKANSIQAYQDFKKHGIDLEIIYIDRVKVANNEARKIDTMIKEYLINYDLELLREIINKYESNICGCDFIGMGKKESLNLFNQHELFMTDRIQKLLCDTIEYIENIQDINERKLNITTFIKIIDEEQYKFDLLNDLNKDRAHKFELNDDNLKQQIEKLRLLIKDNTLTSKKVI